MGGNFPSIRPDRLTGHIMNRVNGGKVKRRLFWTTEDFDERSRLAEPASGGLARRASKDTLSREGASKEKATQCR